MAGIISDIDAAGSEPHSLIEIIEKANSNKDENTAYPIIQKYVERKTYIEKEINSDLETPLILACKYGMSKIAELLIQNSVSNINQVSKQKTTALIYSCKNALDTITLLLLEKGANTIQVDTSGVYAFAYSCSYGSEEISLDVLKKTSPDILDHLFVIENGTYTALMIACLRGYTKIIDELLKRKVSIHTLNSQGMTAIAYALFFGKEETVIKLLSKVSVIHYNKIVKHGGVSYTYFSAAARLKMFDVVKFLIETQKHDKKDMLNLLYVNNEGYHFFDYFFLKSHEYIKLKIAEMADYLPEKRMKMARELVAKFDSLAVEVCSLYKDMNLFIPFHKQNTVLIYAAKCGYEKTFVHLLERLSQHPRIHKPYINIYNSDNNTAIFYLFPGDETIFTREMQKRVLDAMKPFYQYIDYAFVDNYGNSIFMHSILRGNYEFVISLLETEQNAREAVKITNTQNGNTLLHCIEAHFSVKYGIPTITNRNVFEEYKSISREAKRVFELAVGIAPTILSIKNQENTNSIMVCSILHDSRDLLEQTIKNEPSLDINEFNTKHMNPLLYSCIFKNENAIYLLSLENIQYNPVGNNESPFSVACYSNNDKIAMEFLKHDDLDVNTTDEDGNTPLINACISGLENLALKIIEKSPEAIYAMNIHYMRPLHFAVMSKSQVILDKIEAVHLSLNPPVEDKEINNENSFKKGTMLYCENRKIHDYISGTEMALEDYLEENPEENMYFEILTDDFDKENVSRTYGLTTKTKIIDALNPKSVNSYFYGCTKAVNNFMELYNSGDPVQQEEARSFVDLTHMYIYMLPLMGIPGLMTPELFNILRLDLNRHRCFGLIKVDAMNYESIVNSMVIHSNSFYSTSTTHCEPMTKPYVYICLPMEPKSSRKRKRTPDIASVRIATSPNNVIHISYKDKVYDIKEDASKITFNQLRELVIEKLVAEEKLGNNATKENVKMRFLYLGKLYNIEKNGDDFVGSISGYDPEKAFNVLVQIVGGRKHRQSTQKKRTSMGKKTRRIIHSQIKSRVK